MSDIEDIIEEVDSKETKRLEMEALLPPELSHLKKTVRPSTLNGIFESNKHDRDLFYAFLDGKLPKKIQQLVINSRERPNQREWEDVGVNSMDPKYACPNACRYCYTLAMDRRRNVTREKTGKYHRNEKIVRKGWKALPEGVTKTALLFSVHDITDEVVDDFLTIATKMIKAGYDILVVSKLRLSVATRIGPFLVKHKDHIEIRVTIGTCDPKTARFWEPGAPMPNERVKALFYLSRLGANVSVSMEPLLGDDPVPFVQFIQPFVKSIWIGTMNHCETFVGDMSRINEQKRYLLYLVKTLRDIPNVFWKRSIIMDIKLKRGLETPNPDVVKAERDAQTEFVNLLILENLR